MNAAGFPASATAGGSQAGPRSSSLSQARIRALIADATTDSLDESDEHACLASMLQEEVVCPFPAKIDGEVVECLGFQGLRCGYRMNAICRSKKGKTIVVDFTKLELIDPRPRGAEWLEAYAAWQSMQDH